MPRILVSNSNKTIEYAKGKDLLQILIENDTFVDNACNGRGTCGKCKVRVIEGDLPEVSETESKLLTEKEISTGKRLACLIIPQEDLTIELVNEKKEHKILTEGYVPEFEFSPSIKKIPLEIPRPTLENQHSFEDLVCTTLGIERFDWQLLKHQEPIYGKCTAIFNSIELVGLEIGDTSKKNYGVAIDIGTTTVVAALIDISTGEELATQAAINPQKKYGLDVLTRITYILENPDKGREELQKTIVNEINGMLVEMCKQANVNINNIYEITIGANCTMLHLLLGIDPSSIGKSPYSPAFVKSKNIPAISIGLGTSPFTRLYCLPSVSAFIGADIVAGAYVCQLHKSKGNTLFIDIGTNGEIVLASKGKLLSCSCAAGPALEGMNISSGMRGAEGAIEEVNINNNGIELTVIGDKEPIGICGSGILAAVRELVKAGLVRKEGVFIKKESLEETDYRYNMLQLNGAKREFILHQGPKQILITQGDLRQVQLAKGAILSGFYSLLKRVGVEMHQLDKVIIAGQFGAHLSPESIVGTNILPLEIKDKLSYVGNTSKTGAYMALMSDIVKKEIEELANKIDYMELGATEGYERLFTDCLMFR